MAVMPSVLRPSDVRSRPAVLHLAVAAAVLASLFMLGTTLLNRQYSTRVTSAPLGSEYAAFKTLTLSAIGSVCSSGRLVVLGPSDVASLDLAGQLERLPCDVVRPTVVTPLHNVDAAGGVFVVETSFAAGGRPAAENLARMAAAEARAVGITAPLQPIDQSATEHFVVSEYSW